MKRILHATRMEGRDISWLFRYVFGMGTHAFICLLGYSAVCESNGASPPARSRQVLSVCAYNYESLMSYSILMLKGYELVDIR